MIKKAAQIFSILLHPLFMPLAGISILLFTGSYVSLLPLAARRLIILLFASGTILLPAIMMSFTYLRGNTVMNNQNERSIPLALSFIFYLFTYFLFLKVPVYPFMHNFMLAATVSVLFSLIINLRWKISLHMVGLGGLTAFLLIISFTRQINLYPWLILAILASGITGSSRLYLNFHSPSQVYSGYFVGALTMSACLLMLAK